MYSTLLRYYCWIFIAVCVLVAYGPCALTLSEHSWIKAALFSANSVQARQMTAAMLQRLANSSPMRKSSVIDLMTKWDWNYVHDSVLYMQTK